MFSETKERALKTTESEAFVVLLDHLRKNHGISNAFVGKSIGLKVDKIRNIKRGGSSAEKAHLIALFNKFPKELEGKAEELGLEIDLKEEPTL